MGTRKGSREECRVSRKGDRKFEGWREKGRKKKG